MSQQPLVKSNEQRSSEVNNPRLSFIYGTIGRIVLTCEREPTYKILKGKKSIVVANGFIVLWEIISCIL